MRSVLLTILTMLLGACVSTPPAPESIPPRPARESLQKFGLNGRVAILQGTRSNTVRMAWEHNGKNDAIGFATPLGSLLAELQRNSQGAVWLTADGERYEARSADRLITRLTDAPVPVDALTLWITGRLTASAENIVRDPAGRLMSANDLGWAVRINAYESELPNALPRNLEVEYTGLRLKIIVEEWLL
jgi:outer membrane lipoprotein LolB